MQQIERYGVIALLFLLVTIVVVALWDGGDPTEAAGGEKEKVAQVDRAKTQANTRDMRNTINRRQTNTRGTRTQAQNRAKMQESQGARLNRGDAGRDAMNQRSRLVSPNGVPSNPNARPMRPRNQVNQKQPVRRDLTSLDPVAKKKSQGARGFKAELPRGRNTNQFGGGKNALANIATVASDSTTAFRDIRNNAKENIKRKPDPVKGPLYVIKSGDSLERIARHTLGDGSRWREIQKLNGMRGTTVVVGKKLRLPVGADPSRTSYADAKKKARGVSEAASSVAAGAGYYAVKSGDSLGLIAQHELGSVNRMGEILALNPGLTANNLQAGSKIRMPVRGKTSARKTSARKTSTKKPSTKKRSKPKTDSRYVVH